MPCSRCGIRHAALWSVVRPHRNANQGGCTDRLRRAPLPANNVRFACPQRLSPVSSRAWARMQQGYAAVRLPEQRQRACLPAHVGIPSSHSRWSRRLWSPSHIGLRHTHAYRADGLRPGTREGMHISLEYSGPMRLGDVAADFLCMPVARSRPSLPWTEEGLATTQHMTSVCHHMTGWPLKRLPEKFIRCADSVLEEKTPFDSKWFALGPDRWLKDVEASSFMEWVRPLGSKGRRASIAWRDRVPRNHIMPRCAVGRAGIEGATGDENDRPCAARRCDHA